jgi:PAS domain S-box-containing protein
VAVGASLEWGAEAGVAGIGAAALLALLAIYRRMRSRLGALGAIREALVMASHPSASAPALTIAEHLGPEAKAWNEIVADLEKLRKQGVSEKVREALGQQRDGKNDLEGACDALSQGLLLVDEQNRIRYANGAAAAFLRARREDLLGSDASKHVQIPSVIEAIKNVAAGAGRRRSVQDVERQDDSRGGVLRFSVRPVRRDDSAAVMLTIEDITQQKVAEEARNSFVAQATHELRTPLTNIRLYVETAIEEGENDAATRAKCLNVINGEARRLERIVGEMLSVAEIEAGSFKMKRDDVRLDAIFAELEADYRQQAEEKKIGLKFKLPPKLPVLQGDRDKLMLALHNLVANALKYTPDGGQVTVNVETADGQLMVAVADSGIGIAPDDQQKIFERFYRADDPRVAKITGTGLGLTLAREVARLHGGDVAVESELNRGSTFTLTVPAPAEAA